MNLFEIKKKLTENTFSFKNVAIKHLWMNFPFDFFISDAQLKKEADHGDANSMFAYGTRLLKKRKLKESRAYLERALQKKCYRAIPYLALMHMNGDGVEKCKSKGIDLLRLGIDHQDPASMHVYACVLEDDQNYTEAMKFFKMAAEHGIEESRIKYQHYSSLLYNDSSDAGEGELTPTFENGLKFLRLEMYNDAIFCFQHCRNSQSDVCMTILGLMYFFGLGDSNRNHALQILFSSADKGNFISQNFLGIVYFYGISIPQNFKASRVNLLSAIQNRKNNKLEVPSILEDPAIFYCKNITNGLFDDHKYTHKELYELIQNTPPSVTKSKIYLNYAQNEMDIEESARIFHKSKIQRYEDYIIADIFQNNSIVYPELYKLKIPFSKYFKYIKTKIDKEEYIKLKIFSYYYGIGKIHNKLKINQLLRQNPSINEIRFGRFVLYITKVLNPTDKIEYDVSPTQLNSPLDKLFSEILIKSPNEPDSDYLYELSHYFKQTDSWYYDEPLSQYYLIESACQFNFLAERKIDIKKEIKTFILEYARSLKF